MPEVQVTLQRIARLEAENARLEAENTLLLEQFARWAYNTPSRGLGLDFLSQPLVIDREASEIKATPSKTQIRSAA